MKKILAGVLAAVMMLTMLSGCNLLEEKAEMQEVLLGDWTITTDVRMFNGFFPEEQRPLVTFVTLIANLFLEPLTIDASFHENGIMHLELSQGAKWLDGTLGKLDGVLGTNLDSIMGEDGGIPTTILKVLENGVGDFNYYTVDNQLYVWGTWQTQDNALIFTCTYIDDTVTITQISDGNNVLEITGGALRMTRIKGD